MKGIYRCWAEIDRRALRHNAKIVRERVGSAEVLAVVKANAYGHGLMGVAETLAGEAQLFGVANLEEALALRESFSHPIILLGPTLPGERSTIAERGFIPTISALEEAQDFNRVALRSPVPINFKIDTGMGRMGVPEDQALDVLKKISTFANIRIHSISTHLPVAVEDADYTRDQLLRFGEIMKQFRAAVPIDYTGYADGYPWHLSNRDAAVLVRGQRCPILGRVTMDLMMIDVSNLDHAQVGDEVVLMGRDGNEEISCAELAKTASTIPWEITTRIGARVRRVYV